MASLEKLDAGKVEQYFVAVIEYRRNPSPEMKRKLDDAFIAAGGANAEIANRIGYAASRISRPEFFSLSQKALIAVAKRNLYS